MMRNHHPITALLTTILLTIITIQPLSAQPRLVSSPSEVSAPETVPAGNYSGITRIAYNEYAVVNDKAADNGFFRFRIDIDSVSGRITHVSEEGFVGHPGKAHDMEDIVYHPSTHTLFIACEATQEVKEYDMSGQPTGRALKIPAQLRKAGPAYGLESLAYHPDTHTFWTTTESTLPGDGDQATALNRAKNHLRLQAFDEELRPTKQYHYEMDAPTAKKAGTNYAMGVSAMTALADGTLLVLEREFYVPKNKLGAFVRCKIYHVNPAKGKTCKDNAPLPSPLKKSLVTEWRTSLSLFDYDIANYEGMCLGPTLTDGSQVIVLVSDSQNQYAGVLQDWFKTLVVRF